LIGIGDSATRGNFPVIGCSEFFKNRCKRARSE
jgi:hypothetical protein